MATNSKAAGVMLGSNVIATFAIGIGAGLALDNKYETEPMWILIGLGVSLLMVALLMVKFVKLTNKEAMNARNKK